VRIERHSGYRIWVGGPVPRGADGITLGRTIIVRKHAAESQYLRLHERVHVEQYQALGVPGFLVRYALSYLRGRVRGYPHQAAYRRIPLEVEADWVARRLLWESRSSRFARGVADLDDFLAGDDTTPDHPAG
jgi:hypothetical protein